MFVDSPEAIFRPYREKKIADNAHKNKGGGSSRLRPGSSNDGHKSMAMNANKELASKGKGDAALSCIPIDDFLSGQAVMIKPLAPLRALLTGNRRRTS